MITHQLINFMLACNCFGHSESCVYYNATDTSHLSIDIHGKYEGGGVCQNCRDHTTGINCDKCVFGFYRPVGKLLNETDVCQRKLQIITMVYFKKFLIHLILFNF